jgi:hypothetical protein
MYKLEFYVPTKSTEAVLMALFKVGAGRIGDYDSCCFITEGTGQFRPLSGSSPYIGKKEILEKVAENKVELVLNEKIATQVKKALIEAHPYETPTYQFIKFNDNLGS